MKKLKWIVLLVVVSLFFVACNNDSETAGNAEAESTENTQNEDESESEVEAEPEVEPEPTDEELLALAIEERNEQDAINKERDGAYYVPLPTIDSIDDLNPELVTAEAKALYVTSNIAGFNFDEEDVQLYADHIRYLAGESTEAVDQTRLNNDVNRLEEILGICMARK